MITILRVMSVLAVIAALPGCGITTPPILGDPAPVRDGPVRVDNVVLAEDRLSVRVDFVGSSEFDPESPCSNPYVGTAKIVGGELEIGVYAEQHPQPLAPGTACGGVGYPRALTLELDEPFTGIVVRDSAGQVFHLEPP